MSKDKQQKKKDREKRVAKKLLVEAEERREREKSSGQDKKGASRSSKIMTGSVPMPGRQVSAVSKTNFSQRRSGK